MKLAFALLFAAFSAPSFAIRVLKSSGDVLARVSASTEPSESNEAADAELSDEVTSLDMAAENDPFKCVPDYRVAFTEDWCCSGTGTRELLKNSADIWVFWCKAAAAELSDEVTRSSDELSDEVTRLDSESGIRASDLGFSTEESPKGLAEGEQCGGSSWTGPG